MKKVYTKLIFLFICLMPLMSVAQETKTKDSSPIANREKRKKAKEKWKKDRTVERDNKKAIKDHHKKLQTKNTLKAMKKEKRKSNRFRANKKKNFITRMFH